MTSRLPGIATMLALLVPAAPALAADQSVTATGSNTFAPKDVTVNVGETVTWTNTGGTHNVHFTDNSFTQPDSLDAPWTVSRTFSAVGTFSYVCQVHETTDNMTGTVTVPAAGAPPPPVPGPPGQTVIADKVAPAVTLSGRTRQGVLRSRAVFVTVAVNEASTVSARGTISVPGSAKAYRLRKASRKVAAGAKAQLKLRLSKAAQRAVRRALARRLKLAARLTVTAKDAAGNTRSEKRKVRLKL
jgi:plastocyanin